MAIFVIMRAVFGYLFLVLMVRIVGRRPGKQLTPFEFVLIFYLGGLTLTAKVGDEASLTNAFIQVLTLDGSPLTLLEDGQWHTETLTRMSLQDDDVMDMAREQGLRDLTEIDSATLETFGEISIRSNKDD